MKAIVFALLQTLAPQAQARQDQGRRGSAR
jgi:hypothetical protein